VFCSLTMVLCCMLMMFRRFFMMFVNFLVGHLCLSRARCSVVRAHELYKESQHI
jgi:hypothetical protein